MNNNQEYIKNSIEAFRVHQSDIANMNYQFNHAPRGPIPDPTARQHMMMQIEHLQAELAKRTANIKKLDAAGLLDLPMNELRALLNY